ncbi:hypothetical protein E2542_SST13297 [Spatholobus suberectus]|nr:hypothetical protein E2542_SST13297 [Spatholobus suberectus]
MVEEGVDEDQRYSGEQDRCVDGAGELDRLNNGGGERDLGYDRAIGNGFRPEFEPYQLHHVTQQHSSTYHKD